MSFTIMRFHSIYSASKFMYTFIHGLLYIYIYNCPGIRNVIYYACLNTIKYYTVQVTHLYTDASDSQNNHTEVDNIIQMQMTPKIITIRYIIKRYKISPH